MTMPRILVLLLVITAVPSVARAQMGGMGGGMGGMGGMGGGGPPPRGAQDDQLPDVDPKIANDPDAVLAKADADFAAGSYVSALAHYQHIRQRFSFNMPVASRALLGLGDVAFAREKWSEARSNYRSFLRFYPTHERAPHAAYRVGLSSFKDIPSANPFLPPQFEKDQSEAATALSQFRQFIEQFPASPDVPEARRLMVECEDKLAAHELYVADFNASRGKWKGVLLRADTLLRKYPASTLVPAVLVLAIDAHLHLGEKDAARDVLARLKTLEPPAAPDVLAKAEKLVAGAADLPVASTPAPP